MMRFLLPYIFMLSLGVSNAQISQKVQVWYEDSTKTLKEVFHVQKDNPNVLEGEYIKYFQDGDINIKGGYINNEPVGTWNYYFENGNIKMSGERENANEGHWKYYYENGSLKMQGRVEGSQKEGRWIYYYVDGQVKSIGNYKEGEKQGDWKYFYEDNNLKALATYQGNKGVYTEYYTNGIRKMHCFVKDEERDSTVTHFYENGQIKSQGTEKQSIKNGHWVFFYKDGVKASEGDYKDGEQVGNWVYYYPTGEKKTEGTLENGLEEGDWKVYYLDGTIKGEMTFRDGSGPYKIYYKNGQLKIAGQLKNGKREGKWEYFYENGDKKGECNYNEDKGKYVGYYKDGTKRREGFMEGGRKVGVWKHYDEDGTFDSSIVYVYDDEMGEEMSASIDSEVQEKVIEEKKKEYPGKNISKIRNDCKLEWFCPRWPKEFKGRILSVNPFALLFGQLPISFEFYMQERLGYEITYTQFRNPLFGSKSGLEEGDLFYQGFGVGIKQKFYMLHEDFGMWYFGHELRYKALNYDGLAADTLIAAGRSNVGAMEHAVEYVILVGDRIMGKYNLPGYTFDIFAGVGFGYRSFVKDFEDTPETDEVYELIGQKKFYIPIRFGFSFGYVF